MLYTITKFLEAKLSIHLKVITEKKRAQRLQVETHGEYDITITKKGGKKSLLIRWTKLRGK
jgi:hypothetical protein